MKELTLRCPDGHEILGTLEIIQGRADVYFYRQEDGSIGYDFEGGTEMFWDSSTTASLNGNSVFLCRDGGEWTLDECIVDDAEEGA